MAKNNHTRVYIKRKKTNDEREANCRRRINGLLQLIGFQCPSTDYVTLRAEAECKLNEIKKRKPTRQDSISPDIVACVIKKRKPSTASRRVHSLDSTLTKGSSRFNPCVEKRRREVNHQETEFPPKVKTYIEKIRGSDEMVELVFEKKLTASDVNRSQGRLLMPLKQVQAQDVLKEMEKMGAVRLYVPSRQQYYDLGIAHWDMNGNQNYVLKSGWNQVVKENKLRMSTVVQLWSFQVGDTPCLLLVPVDAGNDSKTRWSDHPGTHNDSRHVI